MWHEIKFFYVQVTNNLIFKDYFLKHMEHGLRNGQKLKIFFFFFFLGKHCFVGQIIVRAN